MTNTYSLFAEQCFLKPNSFAATQENPAFYGTQSFSTAVPRSLPTVLILSELDPVHTPTSHILKIQLNIILPHVMKITIPKVTMHDM